LRRELLAHGDACVAQIKTVFETEVATLQRQLAEARAEQFRCLSGTAELKACTHKPVWSKGFEMFAVRAKLEN
jgi:hypothetical protein